MIDDGARNGQTQCGGEALSTILRTALTRPDDLGDLDLRVIESGLFAESGEAELALAGVAASLYGRPDLVGPGVVGRLRGLVSDTTLPERLEAPVAHSLRFLLFAAEAQAVVSLVLDGLKCPATGPGMRRRLLEVLRDCLQWKPGLLDVDDVVASAGQPGPDDDFTLGLIERYVYLAPDRFDQAFVAQLSKRFGNSPRFKYVAHVAGADMPEEFPVRASATRVLRDPSFRLLVVVNSLFGQGDEIVRTVPLLQGVLDANPTASITVLSQRRYVFDHPRIEQRSLWKDSEVNQALQARYDGVVHFHEPRWEHFNRRPDLIAAVDKAIERLRPRFVLCGDHGDHRFAYQRLQVEGREWASERGLDEARADNIYEPCRRLLIELGLPLRHGEQSGRSGSILIAEPSNDAARLWDRMTPKGDSGRPIALVNPFGGAAAGKGYTVHHFPQLAAEISALVEEGYNVVIIPNGTRWGRRSHAEAVAARLTAKARTRVVIGPDPAERLPWQRLSLSERPDLSYADRIMRLYKYLFARADLTVTVEGWGSHLAYALGRPFRLVLMAQSAPCRWHPDALGPHQQLVTEMSPLARLEYGPTDKLSGDPGAPCPRRYRKDLLEVALGALGRLDGPESHAVLSKALGSVDDDLRRLATAGLRRNGAGTTEALSREGAVSAWVAAGVSAVRRGLASLR